MIPRRRNWSGWIWTEVREISRQPLDAEGLGPTKNKGRVSSDCPSQTGRDNRHPSCESLEAGANQRGQAHSTPQTRRGRPPPELQTGTTASGALVQFKSELRAYLGTPKSKTSRGGGVGGWEIPSLTGTPVADPSDLALSAGLGWPSPRGCQESDGGRG